MDQKVMIGIGVAVVAVIAIIAGVFLLGGDGGNDSGDDGPGGGVTPSNPSSLEGLWFQYEGEMDGIDMSLKWEYVEVTATQMTIKSTTVIPGMSSPMVTTQTTPIEDGEVDWSNKGDREEGVRYISEYGQVYGYIYTDGDSETFIGKDGIVYAMDFPEGTLELINTNARSK